MKLKRGVCWVRLPPNLDGENQAIGERGLQSTGAALNSNFSMECLKYKTNSKFYYNT